MHLFLNPGHAPDGQPDPGAVAADGTGEWYVNRRIAAAIAEKCRAVGVQVTCVQADDLNAVVAAAERSGADYFLSVHANAATNPAAHGAEIYTCPAASVAARQWAERIAASAIAQGVHWRSGTGRAYKTADLYVLRAVSMPAVLLETGFMTHPGDFAQLCGPAPEQWATIISASLPEI